MTIDDFLKTIVTSTPVLTGFVLVYLTQRTQIDTLNTRVLALEAQISTLTQQLIGSKPIALQENAK